MPTLEEQFDAANVDLLAMSRAQRVLLGVPLDDTARVAELRRRRPENPAITTLVLAAIKDLEERLARLREVVA